MRLKGIVIKKKENFNSRGYFFLILLKLLADMVV